MLIYKRDSYADFTKEEQQCIDDAIHNVSSTEELGLRNVEWRVLVAETRQSVEQLIQANQEINLPAVLVVGDMEYIMRHRANDLLQANSSDVSEENVRETEQAYAVA